MTARFKDHKSISKFPKMKPEEKEALGSSFGSQKTRRWGSTMRMIPRKQPMQHKIFCQVRCSPTKMKARTSVKKGPVFCTIDTLWTSMRMTAAFKMSIFEPPKMDLMISSLEREGLGLVLLSSLLTAWRVTWLR